MVVPPPLPRKLSQVGMVAAVGAVLWLLAAVALLVTWLVAGQLLGFWFTTCMTGAVLGGVGYGIYCWQRAAARRGSRVAQQGLE